MLPKLYGLHKEEERYKIIALCLLLLELTIKKLYGTVYEILQCCVYFSVNSWQKFPRQSAPVLAVFKLKYGSFKHNYWTNRPNYHPKLLLTKPQYGQSSRGYAMFVARLIKGALKVRYLLLGGALGGGYSLQKVSFQLCEVKND